MTRIELWNKNCWLQDDLNWLRMTRSTQCDRSELSLENDFWWLRMTWSTEWQQLSALKMTSAEIILHAFNLFTSLSNILFHSVTTVTIIPFSLLYTYITQVACAQSYRHPSFTPTWMSHLGTNTLPPSGRGCPPPPRHHHTALNPPTTIIPTSHWCVRSLNPYLLFFTMCL